MQSEAKAAFSFLVKVGHVSANPINVTLEANDQERLALADQWNVLAVNSLEASLRLTRWKRDGVRLAGDVTANLTQECVITLEPIPTRVETTFEMLFVPEGSKLARMVQNDDGEMVLDAEGPDLPEEFSGDKIDVGAAVAEYAAMAIETYPKAANAQFEGHIESDAATDKAPSPFAVLENLKPKT